MLGFWWQLFSVVCTSCLKCSVVIGSLVYECVLFLFYLCHTGFGQFILFIYLGHVEKNGSLYCLDGMEETGSWRGIPSGTIQTNSATVDVLKIFHEPFIIRLNFSFPESQQVKKNQNKKLFFLASLHTFIIRIILDAVWSLTLWCCLLW